MRKFSFGRRSQPSLADSSEAGGALDFTQTAGRRSQPTIGRVLSFGRGKTAGRRRQSTEAPDAAVLARNEALLASDEVAKGWLSVRCAEAGIRERTKLYAVFHKQVNAPSGPR